MRKDEFNPRIVTQYFDRLIDDPDHRYKSWEHCYNAFGKVKDIDVLCLHLSFYLASWGMYRGSGGLLQKDYKIHKGAIKILLRRKFRLLRCTKKNEVTTDSIDSVIGLSDELKTYYNSIEFRGKKGKKNIKATNTLISKILLGTLGCTPAFDRYFVSGAKKCNLRISNFANSSIKCLLDFISQHESQIRQVQRSIYKNGTYYPSMKILDMYFWQIGFKQSNREY